MDVQDASRRAVPCRRQRRTRALLGLIALAGGAGSVATYMEIRTISVSGGAMLLLCGALGLYEIRCVRKGREHFWLGTIMALAGVLFPLGVWLLIVVNKWSPTRSDQLGVDEACVVFGVLIVVHASALIALRRCLKPGKTHSDSWLGQRTELLRLVLERPLLHPDAIRPGLPLLNQFFQFLRVLVRKVVQFGPVGFDVIEMPLRWLIPSKR